MEHSERKRPKLADISTGKHYYANKFSYRIVREDDGWYSIYRLNEFTGKYMPQLQAKTWEKATEFCDLCEPKVVPMDTLC